MNATDFAISLGIDVTEPGAVLQLGEVLSNRAGREPSDLRSLRSSASYKGLIQETQGARETLGLIRQQIKNEQARQAAFLEADVERQVKNRELQDQAGRLAQSIHRRLERNFLGEGASEEDVATAKNSLFGHAIRDQQIQEEFEKITDEEILTDAGQAKLLAINGLAADYAQKRTESGVTNEALNQYKQEIQFDELYRNRGESNINLTRFVRNTLGSAVGFAADTANLGLSLADSVVPGNILSQAGEAISGVGDRASRAIDDRTSAGLLANERSAETLARFDRGELSRGELIAELAGDQSLESVVGLLPDVAGLLIPGAGIARGLQAGGRVGQAAARAGGGPLLAASAGDFADVAVDPDNPERAEQAALSVLGAGALTAGGGLLSRLGLTTVEGAVGAGGLRGLLGAGQGTLNRRVLNTGGTVREAARTAASRAGAIGARTAGGVGGEGIQGLSQEAISQLVEQAGADNVGILDGNFQALDEGSLIEAGVLEAIAGGPIAGVRGAVQPRETRDQAFIREGEAQLAALGIDPQTQIEFQAEQDNAAAQAATQAAFDAQGPAELDDFTLTPSRRALDIRNRLDREDALTQEASVDFANDQTRRLNLLEESRILGQNQQGRQAFRDLQEGQEFNALFNPGFAPAPQSSTNVLGQVTGQVPSQVGPAAPPSTTTPINAGSPLGRATRDVIDASGDRLIGSPARRAEQGVRDGDVLTLQERNENNADLFLSGRDQVSPIQPPTVGQRIADTARAALPVSSAGSPATPASQASNPLNTGFVDGQAQRASVITGGGIVNEAELFGDTTGGATTVAPADVKTASLDELTKSAVNAASRISNQADADDTPVAANPSADFIAEQEALNARVNGAVGTESNVSPTPDTVETTSDGDTTPPATTTTPVEPDETVDPDELTGAAAIAEANNPEGAATTSTDTITPEELARFEAIVADPTNYGYTDADVPQLQDVVNIINDPTNSQNNANTRQALRSIINSRNPVVPQTSAAPATIAEATGAVAPTDAPVDGPADVDVLVESQPAEIGEAINVVEEAVRNVFPVGSTIRRTRRSQARGRSRSTTTTRNLEVTGHEYSDNAGNSVLNLSDGTTITVNEAALTNGKREQLVQANTIAARAAEQQVLADRQVNAQERTRINAERAARNARSAAATQKTADEVVATAKVAAAEAAAGKTPTTNPDTNVDDTSTIAEVEAKNELAEARARAAVTPDEAVTDSTTSRAVEEALESVDSVADLKNLRDRVQRAQAAVGIAEGALDTVTKQNPREPVPQEYRDDFNIAKSNFETLEEAYNAAVDKINDQGTFEGTELTQPIDYYDGTNSDEASVDDAVAQEQSERDAANTDPADTGEVLNPDDPNATIPNIPNWTKGKTFTLSDEAFGDTEFTAFSSDGRGSKFVVGLNDSTALTDFEPLVPDDVTNLRSFRKWINGDSDNARRARTRIWETAGKKSRGAVLSPASDGLTSTTSALNASADSSTTASESVQNSQGLDATNSATQRRQSGQGAAASDAQATVPEIRTTPGSRGSARTGRTTGASNQLRTGLSGETNRTVETPPQFNDARQDGTTETTTDSQLSDDPLEGITDEQLEDYIDLDDAGAIGEAAALESEAEIDELLREVRSSESVSSIYEVPPSSSYGELDFEEQYNSSAFSEVDGLGITRQRRSDFVSRPLTFKQARKGVEKFFGKNNIRNNVEFLTLDQVSDEFKNYIEANSGESIDYRTKMLVSDGKLYIFPEHIGHPNDLALYLAHEVLGHVGLRERFGPRLDGLLDELYLSLGSVDGVLARDADIGAGLRRNYPTTVANARSGDKQAQRNLTEELLAHLQERGDISGARQPILKRIANQVRRWLRRKLSPVTSNMFDWTVSDAELFYLLSEAGHAGRATFDSERPLNTPRALQVKSVGRSISEGWSDTVRKGRTWDAKNSALIGRTLGLLGFDASTTPGEAWSNLNKDIKDAALAFNRDPNNRFNRFVEAQVHDRNSLHLESDSQVAWMNANEDFTNRGVNEALKPTRDSLSRVSKKGKQRKAKQADVDVIARNMDRLLTPEGIDPDVTPVTRAMRLSAFKVLSNLGFTESLAHSEAETLMKRDLQVLLGQMEDAAKQIAGAVPGRVTIKRAFEAADTYRTGHHTLERNHAYFYDHFKNDRILFGGKATKDDPKVRPRLVNKKAKEILDAAYKRTNSTDPDTVWSMDQYQRFSEAVIKRYVIPSRVPQFEAEYLDYKTTGKTRSEAQADLVELGVVPGTPNYNAALHQSLEAMMAIQQQIIDKSLTKRQEVGTSQIRELKAVQRYGFKYYTPQVGFRNKDDRSVVDASIRQADSLTDTVALSTGKLEESMPAHAAILHHAAMSYHGQADNRMKEGVAALYFAAQNQKFAEISKNGDTERFINGVNKKGEPVQRQIRFGDANAWVLDRNSSNARNAYSRLIRNMPEDTFIVHLPPDTDINDVKDDPAALNAYGKNDNSGKVLVIRYNKNESAIPRLVKGVRESNTTADYLRKNFPHLARSSSYFGQMHTTYNPNYPLVQLFRDTLASFWTVAADGGFPAAKHYINALVSQRGQLRKMAQYMFHVDQTGQASADIVNRLRKDKELANFIDWHDIGAPVQFSQALSMDSSLESYVRGLSNSALTSTEKDRLDQGDSIIRLATIMTDTIGRTAAYQSQLDQGKSKQEAAAFAKNIANFERRGSAGSADFMSLAYMFYRPTVIGATQITKSLLSSKYNTEAAGIASGLGVAFFATAAMLSPEDDEGNNLFLTQRPSTTHFQLWLDKDAPPLQMPYSYNPFTAIMATTVQVMYGMTGNQSAVATAGNIFDVLASNVSPVSNSIPLTDDNGEFDVGLLGAKLTDLAAPTISAPIVALGLNRNNFGNEISPWSGSVYGPGSLGESFNSTTGQVGGISEDISRLLFNTFGFSPDVRRMDYVLSELASGPRNFANSILEWERILTNSDYSADWKRAGIGVGSFIGSPHNRTKNDYYRTKSILDSATKDQNFLTDTGRYTPEQVDDLLTDHYGPDILNDIEVMKPVTSALRKVNADMKEIRRTAIEGDAYRMDRLEELDREGRSIMARGRTQLAGDY